jgi:hypothetical protein
MGFRHPVLPCTASWALTQAIIFRVRITVHHYGHPCADNIYSGKYTERKGN